MTRTKKPAVAIFEERTTAGQYRPAIEAFFANTEQSDWKGPATSLDDLAAIPQGSEILVVTPPDENHIEFYLYSDAEAIAGSKPDSGIYIQASGETCIRGSYDKSRENKLEIKASSTVNRIQERWVSAGQLQQGADDELHIYFRAPTESK